MDITYRQTDGTMWRILHAGPTISSDILHSITKCLPRSQPAVDEEFIDLMFEYERIEILF